MLRLLKKKVRITIILSTLVVALFLLLFVDKKINILGTKSQNDEIIVYNWGEFIDPEVNAMFSEKTGICVNYKTFQSNEEIFAKISAGNLDADVVITSDYMISKLSKNGYLQKINYNNIPNYAFISNDFKGMSFDPDNEFSVPYSWGLFGIVYNSKFVKDDDLNLGWGILWNPKFSGRTLMFDNSRDAFAIALLKMGKSINTEDPEILRLAAEHLKNQKKIISCYVMDQIFDKMISEESWLAPYYAGDASAIKKINKSVDFMIPTSGTNRFVDSMCILKSSKKSALAESYINFLCEPKISERNMKKTNYFSPNYTMIEAISGKTENASNLCVDFDILENSECFNSLSTDTELLIDELWTEIKVGKNDNPWLTFLIIAVLALIYIVIRFHPVIFKREIST